MAVASTLASSSGSLTLAQMMDQVTWKVPKYEPCDSVHMRWEYAGKPLMGYMLVKMIVTHCFVARGVTLTLLYNGAELFKRHPWNNRDENQSRSEYVISIRDKGYHGDARSTPLFMRVDGSESWLPAGAPSDLFCGLMLGAATTTESAYDVIRMYPDNVNALGLIEDGFEAIEVDPKAPKDICTWCVVDFNRWQAGSSFNLQQTFDVVGEYKAAWEYQCKHILKMTTRAFGKGDLSYDSQMWKFLCDTFREDLRFKNRTQYERLCTFVNQMGPESLLDLKCVMQRQLIHKKGTFDLYNFMANACAFEYNIRTVSSDAHAANKHLMVLCALKFCMPLADETASCFHFTGYDVHSIGELSKVDVKFLPRPKSAALGAVDEPPTKRRRKAASVQVESTAAAEANRPQAITLKFWSAVSTIIDEGLEVYTNYCKRDVPRPTDLVQRIKDTICSIIMFSIKRSVQIVDLTGTSDVADWRIVRHKLHDKLHAQAATHVSEDDLRAHFDQMPTDLESQSPPDAHQAHSQAPDDDTQATIPSDHGEGGAASATASTLALLTDIQALEFMGWIRENIAPFGMQGNHIKKHPAYRRLSDQLQHIAGGVEADAALTEVVLKVCGELKVEWVNEVESSSTPLTFFDTRASESSFLCLRTTYITNLFIEHIHTCDGPTECFQKLVSSSAKRTALAIADSSIDNDSDLLMHWRSLIQWVDEHESATEGEILAAINDCSDNLGVVTSAGKQPAPDAAPNMMVVSSPTGSPASPTESPNTESSEPPAASPSETIVSEPVVESAIVSANASAAAADTPDAQTGGELLASPEVGTAACVPQVSFDQLDKTWYCVRAPGTSSLNCRRSKFMTFFFLQAKQVLFDRLYGAVRDSTNPNLFVRWSSGASVANKAFSLGCSGPVSADFKFWSAGNVCTKPDCAKRLSLCVGTVGKTAVYVLAPDHDDKDENEPFVCAWKIQSSNDALEINCTLEEEAATVNVKVPGSSLKTPVAVKWFYLKPMDSIINTDASETIFVRPKLPGEVKGGKMKVGGDDATDRNEKCKPSFAQRCFAAVSWTPDVEETQDKGKRSKKNNAPAVVDPWAHIKDLSFFPRIK